MPAYRFDAKQYPWTAHYFRLNFPYVLSGKKKVVQAFMDYTSMTEGEVKIVFQENRIPNVFVREKPGHYAFAPPSGDQIWLAKTFVTELEDALGPHKVPNYPKRYSPSDLEYKLFLILEASVLHEMVHFWRRLLLDQAKENMRGGRGPAIEEGIAQQFERKAYGFRPTMHSLAISKYLPKTAQGL